MQGQIITLSHQRVNIKELLDYLITTEVISLKFEWYKKQQKTIGQLFLSYKNVIISTTKFHPQEINQD